MWKDYRDRRTHANVLLAERIVLPIADMRFYSFAHIINLKQSSDFHFIRFGSS